MNFDPQRGNTVYLNGFAECRYEVLQRHGDILRLRRIGFPQDPVLTRHITHLDRTRGAR